MRVSIIMFALCAAASSGCHIVHVGFNCEVTGDRQATMATSGVTEIRVMMGAGSLEIVGGPNLGEIRASGTACADTQAHLDEVELLTSRDGDAVVVESAAPHGQLDLILEVPESLPLVVKDASGSTVISNVAALDLEDGSGSVRVELVGGDVSVRDGAGSLDIERIAGKVTVEEDGSGSIEIDAVGGDVRVEADGSGSIAITNVTGDVLIEEDGSGSISVTDVRGSFRVLQGGSGGIHSDRIAGRVSIP